MKEAAYYTPLADSKVRCDLCPHHCLLPQGKHGLCLTRENRDGTLYSTNYLRPVSTAVDPIEKKPLYHFFPGAGIFSTGPNGCTLKCSFCQNSDISQRLLNTRELPLERFFAAALDADTCGVAYTYSEPYIWFETIMDVGACVKEHGLVNVMVTNGFMEPGPLSELLGLVDAMNIDIKSMSPSFYRRLCKGELAPVLRTCETVKKKCHLEITNLLIPEENDSERDVSKLVDFVATHLGRDTPLHISRYFPRHRLGHSPTPESSLLRAWEIAVDKLDYVYLGNMMAGDKENTFCPGCGELLIERNGYTTHLTDKLTSEGTGKCRCGACGAGINVQLAPGKRTSGESLPEAGQP